MDKRNKEIIVDSTKKYFNAIFNQFQPESTEEVENIYCVILGCLDICSVEYEKRTGIR